MAATGYEGQWFRYENLTDTAQPLGSSRGSAGLEAPSALPAAEGAIVKITIAATGVAGATPPVDVYFRRHGDAWRLVGVERISSSPSS